MTVSVLEDKAVLMIFMSVLKRESMIVGWKGEIFIRFQYNYSCCSVDFSDLYNILCYSEKQVKLCAKKSVGKPSGPGALLEGICISS